MTFFHPTIRYGTAPCGNCGEVSTASLTGEYILCDRTCGCICREGAVQFFVIPGTLCPYCGVTIRYTHVPPENLIEVNNEQHIDGLADKEDTSWQLGL